MIESFPDHGEIRFQKSRDAGGVINATLAFVRRNAREMLVAFFALVVPFALISGIAGALYFRNFGTAFDPEALARGQEPDLGDLFGPAYFLMLVVSMLAFIVALAAIGGFVRLYRMGEAGTISVGLVWDEAKGLILPILGLSVIWGLGIGLSSIIAIIPCLGALAWMAGIIWAFPYAHIAFASRVIEADSIGEAISRARYLVKGAWGYVAGALFLTWLLTYVAVMVVSIPLYAAAGIFSLNTIESDPTQIFASFGYIMPIAQIVGMAAYILPTVATFFIHGRLAMELDGTHLDDELDLLETGVDASASATWSNESAPPPLPDASTRIVSDDDATIVHEDDPDAPPDDDTRPAGGFRGGGFGS